MIRDFDDWAVNQAEYSPFSELRDAVIAVEASHYLRRFLTDQSLKEPLLAALGGLPFLLKKTILDELGVLKSHGITPFFVFDGLEVGRREDAFRASEESARINAQAWDIYGQQQAERAVETFGSSGSVSPRDWYRFFQSILQEAGLDFQVAPYSAWAQLAYLERNASDYVDAIAGSTEILLFEAERLITKLDFQKNEITWIKRRNCLAALDNIPSEIFVDACMLCGTSFFPTLPQLEDAHYHKQPKLRIALDLISELGRSAFSVCLHYQNDSQMRALNYLERYRRSRMAVKHHIIMTQDGTVEPLDPSHAPSDIHEFIGQRLPEELYYYLSKGLIGPRVLDWRTSGDILDFNPQDGGEWGDYQNLVRQGLNPLRSSALTLLSHSLNNYYRHKDITLRNYFERSNFNVITMKDQPDPRPMIGGWKVKSDVIEELSTKLREGHSVLGFAVTALEDQASASKTIPGKESAKLLVTKDEILKNSVWRFLHLNGYLDSKHNLTPWGKILSTAITTLEGKSELEESVFLGIELARLGLLNGRMNFPPSYGPYLRRGSESEIRSSILVSRVACLGKLKHSPIGYTGPLNRHLLAFTSAVATVRSALRDLMEMSIATLFLNADAERERDDLSELGLELPFLLDNDCCLGIAVKSYLDELLLSKDPSSAEAKRTVRDKCTREWFPHATDFSSDVDTAFELWDAVFAGVKNSKDLVVDKRLWEDANAWLAKLR